MNSRRILAAGALLCLLAVPAHAQNVRPSSETAYTLQTSDCGTRVIGTNNSGAMTWTLPQNSGSFASCSGLQVTNQGIQPLFVNAVVSKFNVFDSATGIGYTQLPVSQGQTASISSDGAGNWIADVLQTSKSNGYEKSHSYISYSLSNGGPFFGISGTPTIGDVIGFDYSYDLTPGPGRNTLSFRYTFTTNTTAELETAARNLESQIKFNATLNSLLGPDNAQYFVAVQTAPAPAPQWLLAMNQVWPFNPTKNPKAVVFNSSGHTATIAMLNDLGGGVVSSNVDIGSWLSFGRGTRYAGREPAVGDRIAGIFVTGETVGNSINAHDYQPIYGSFQWTITDPTPGVAKADMVVTAGSVNFLVGNQPVWGLGGVTISGGVLNVNANFSGLGGVGVPVGTVIAMEGPDGAPGAFLNARGFGGAGVAAPGALIMQATRGTGAVPVAVSTNDTLGAISYGGYNGASAYTQSAGISASAAEPYTGGASGSYIGFFTTPIGTNALTHQMTLQQSGALAVGNVFDLGSAGMISAISNTAPSFSAMPGTRFYAAAGNGDNTTSMIESFGSSGSIFAGRSSGGTGAVPSATPANTALVTLNGFGFTDSLKNAPNGAVGIVSDSLWSASNAATHIAFLVTPTGSLFPSEQMRLNQSGGLSVGNLTDPGAGSIAANVKFVAAGVNGVSCSGAPSLSFASVGGIVTHC